MKYVFMLGMLAGIALIPLGIYEIKTKRFIGKRKNRFSIDLQNEYAPLEGKGFLIESVGILLLGLCGTGVLAETLFPTGIVAFGIGAILVKKIARDIKKKS